MPPIEPEVPPHARPAGRPHTPPHVPLRAQSPVMPVQQAPERVPDVRSGSLLLKVAILLLVAALGAAAAYFYGAGF